MIHPSINFRDDECMSSIHIILIMKDMFIIIHRIRGSHAIQMTYKSIISDIFAPSIQYTTPTHITNKEQTVHGNKACDI